MNFLEAFAELDALNEEILTEKQWVVIKPKIISDDPDYYPELDPRYCGYRFLTVNDESTDRRAQVADVVELLSNRKGTYKQTLDRKVLAELISDLEVAKEHTGVKNIADPDNFILCDPDDILSKSGPIKTLTLADRALRSNAHKTLDTLINTKKELTQDDNTEEATLKAKLERRLQGRKYVIHHINGNEDETTLENIILIPYFANDKYDLKVANGIHGALHGASKKSLKNSTVNYTTPLYYFEYGILKEGRCHMALTLLDIE